MSNDAADKLSVSPAPRRAWDKLRPGYSKSFYRYCLINTPPVRAELVEEHDKTRGVIAGEHEKTRGVIIDELTELWQLTQRGFTSQFQREQSKTESYCPNVFILRPQDGPRWKKALTGQKMELQLYCQAPGEWHPATEGGCYKIDDPPQWLKETAPYLRRLVTVLKLAAPLAGPWMSSMPFKDYEEMIKNGIEMTQELVKLLPDIEEINRPGIEEFGRSGEPRQPEQVYGAALRALRAFLKKQDPAEGWGGLERVLTPEGHYLWLCEHHARVYRE